MDTLNGNDTKQHDEARSFLNFLPGQRLKRGRELRGLSTAEVAASLKLSLRFIEAIEQDRYDHLPEPVFVRGYMRSYARLLQLDETDVVAKFDQAFEARQGMLQESDVSQAPRHRRSLSRLAWIGSIVLVLAMLAGGFIWSAREDGDHPETEMPRSALLPISAGPAPSAKPAPASSPVTSVSPVAVPVTSAAVPATDATPAATASAGSTPADTTPAASPSAGLAAPTSAPVTSSAPAAAVAMPPGAAVLQMSLQADAWVQVKDADSGKILLSGMQHAGQMALPGRGPWRLRIGNAEAVRLEKNGQAVDLGPYIYDHVASLTLQP